jgi:hypothetical protein
MQGLERAIIFYLLLLFSRERKTLYSLKKENIHIYVPIRDCPFLVTFLPLQSKTTFHPYLHIYCLFQNIRKKQLPNQQENH